MYKGYTNNMNVNNKKFKYKYIKKYIYENITLRYSSLEYSYHISINFDDARNEMIGAIC